MYIDLSKYNVVTDWNEVAKNVEGVILRVGYRGYESGKIVLDSMFETYAKECYNHNIPFGLYFMSQAITIPEAIEEADFALHHAEKFGASLPIFIDSEDGDGTKKIVRADALSKDDRTDICDFFCKTITQSRGRAGVYASMSWYRTNLNVNKLDKYLLWVAQYGEKCTATHRIDMWQYTSKGSIPGIRGNVDCSICYRMNPNMSVRTLRKGCEGTDVQDLQAVLNYKIAAGLTLDGKFGDKTEKAVMLFQQYYGLEIDGVVGSKTRKKLESV